WIRGHLTDEQKRSYVQAALHTVPIMHVLNSAEGRFQLSLSLVGDPAAPGARLHVRPVLKRLRRDGVDVPFKELTPSPEVRIRGNSMQTWGLFIGTVAAPASSPLDSTWEFVAVAVSDPASLKDPGAWDDPEIGAVRFERTLTTQLQVGPTTPTQEPRPIDLVQP